MNENDVPQQSGDAALPFRSPELLCTQLSRLLVVDMQEKLLPRIEGHEGVLEGCRKLIAGASILDVPVTVTEQYPKGLGPTVPTLAELVAAPVEKIEFSCFPCLSWPAPGDQAEDRVQVVVAGIESHVCVQQTALDLTAAGYRVYVVADAVGSQRTFDYEIALRRLADSGVTVTTVESVLFEWTYQAGTPKFKEISRLVTGR